MIGTGMVGSSIAIGIGVVGLSAAWLGSIDPDGKVQVRRSAFGRAPRIDVVSPVLSGIATQGLDVLGSGALPHVGVRVRV